MHLELPVAEARRLAHLAPTEALVDPAWRQRRSGPVSFGLGLCKGLTWLPFSCFSLFEQITERELILEPRCLTFELRATNTAPPRSSASITLDSATHCQWSGADAALCGRAE